MFVSDKAIQPRLMLNIEARGDFSCSLTDIRLGRKMVAGDKHSSLFSRVVIREEGKKFYRTGIRLSFGGIKMLSRVVKFRREKRRKKRRKSKTFCSTKLNQQNSSVHKTSKLQSLKKSVCLKKSGPRGQFVDNTYLDWQVASSVFGINASAWLVVLLTLVPWACPRS